jgi:asparagine synthase (glutamine-hydrolysing)
MEHSGMRVLAEANARTMSPRPGEIILGRVISRAGALVTQAPRQDIRHDLLHHLLDDHWGEYIAVQVAERAPCSLRILRDPSGAVQCVYGFQHGLFFATSSASLAISLGLVRDVPDWSSVTRSLTCPYLRTGRTCIAGLTELLPGRALTIQGPAASEETLWSPWSFTNQTPRLRDARAAASSVRTTVSMAVRTMAEADRRVLLELSGGLDSSIVAACLSLAEADSTLCTMNAPVPGTDERPYARLVAEHVGLPLQTEELSVDEARFDFPVDPDVVAPAMGILHYAVDQAVSRRAAESTVQSIFSGAGGDSVFGYLRTAAPAADAFLCRRFRVGAAAIWHLSALHGCSVPKAYRLTARKVIRGARPPWTEDHSFLNPELPEQADLTHPWFDPPAGTLPGDRERVFDLIGAQSFRDGMARGARWPLRMPLLAQPVVEACLAVPSWLWIAGGRDRAVARSAFAELLPAAIIQRRSKATYLNYCGEMHARNRTKMLAFLQDGILGDRQLIDVPALRLSLGTPLRPNDLSFMRIFDLCMVENWLRHRTGA